MSSPEVQASLEVLLNGSPFTSSQALFSSVVHCYIRSLVEFGQLLKGEAHDKQGTEYYIAKLSADDLAFFFRSGIVRHKIHLLLKAKLSSVLGSCISIYDELVQLLKEFTSRSLSEHPTHQYWERSGFDRTHILTAPFPYEIALFKHASAPCDTGFDEAKSLRILFDEVIERSTEGEPAIRIVEPTTAQIKAIQDAIHLAGAISHLVLLDIIMNVRHICCIDQYTQSRNTPLSLTIKAVPCTIFLGSGAFDNTFRLMEHIFHEALHLKLHNTSIAIPLFRPGYDGTSSTPFRCSWHSETEEQKATEWTFNRAFAAFHIYVHLNALYQNCHSADDGQLRAWSTRRLAEIDKRYSALRAYVLTEAQSVLTENGMTFLSILVEQGAVVGHTD